MVTLGRASETKLSDTKDKTSNQHTPVPQRFTDELQDIIDDILDGKPEAAFQSAKQKSGRRKSSIPFKSACNMRP